MIRFKRKLPIFVIMVLSQVLLVWFVINMRTSSAWLQPGISGSVYLASSPQEKDTENQTTNATAPPRINKRNTNGKEYHNKITVKNDIVGKIAKLITTNPVRDETSKISRLAIKTAKPKPSIDIVNDYYPFVDFKFVFPKISPKVDRTQDIFMMVLVNSGAKGDDFRKRREAIRHTWGSQRNCEQRKALRDEKLKDLRWLLVFVVGKAGPRTNDDELNMAEARQHNDMLIGNITDNYINNVVKLFMGLVWASRFDIKYIMKTDDDVYVRIPRAVEYLVNAEFPGPFYGGMTYQPIRVNRVIGGKWTVSWKYFGEVNFPQFNAGAYIILSGDLLNRLFNYVYIRKPFHTDDAYLGVAMRDFGIKVTTIFSLAVRRDMNQFIHKANDCQLLRMIGFGHDMHPELSNFLHDRLKKLTCESTTFKC